MAGSGLLTISRKWLDECWVVLNIAYLDELLVLTKRKWKPFAVCEYPYQYIGYVSVIDVLLLKLCFCVFMFVYAHVCIHLCMSAGTWSPCLWSGSPGRFVN